MWGNILTELSFHTNFHLNFSNTKSDVLIHLSQWQYWWWFWFAFVWALYYLIVARVLRYRTLKFRPKIASTFRPHGKWGDLIICVLPVSWCMNILINSSFLMKLIEWQNESSLFTVRIRGRQWYWIYRFDLKNFTDILTTPKNVGHNKWQISVFGDLKTSEDYIHVLQLRSQNKWIKKYWSDVLEKFKKTNKSHIVSPQENFKVEYFNKLNFNNFSQKQQKFTLSSIDNSIILNNNLNMNVYYNNFLKVSVLNKSKFFSESLFNDTTLFNANSENFVLNTNNFGYSNFKKNNLFLFNFFENVTLNNMTSNLITHMDLEENSRWIKRSFGKNAALRLVKYPVSNDKFELNMFKLRFNDLESKLNHKPVPNTTYLTLKQKRYKRRKKIPLFTKLYKDTNGVKNKFSGKLFLKDNALLIDEAGDPTRQYRMVKKNKARHEAIPVVYSKRLLRVKRTLVLPAHVNITAITNSYDVCHSWFIPGLGLKLDCVPGRATHHTFYIDNVGFYYGQCAEICGRYHHHMPIRVCALPFEHFLVWWHSFGIPKLLFTKNERKYETYYAFRKFVW
jgi:hypothetical protein